MTAQALQFATEIVLTLKQAGYIAYWAGGCVRDFLLGIDPADYDIATSADPNQIRRLFGYNRTLPVGAAFGVIIVLSPDRQMQVEVATFRTDAGYSDGRRPDSVTFSTPEMDAQRRDFTINGMFFDPINRQVIDFVGGQEDLRNCTVRAIGDPHARIREDKLRMLRAVRIAARFGFEIDDQTYRAICRHALETSGVSGERLAVELRKTLETKGVTWAVAAWAETGLLQILLPEVAEVWQVTDCAERVLRLLGYPQPISWLGRLAGILWAAKGQHSAATVDRLKSQLKFSNKESSSLSFALRHQTELQSANLLAWSIVQPLLISHGIEIAVQLLQLRTEIGEVELTTIEWIRQRLDWPQECLNPAPILTGYDLLDAGLKGSPRFSQLMHQARCLQLDGELTSRQQAIQWLYQNKPDEKNQL
jgi:poly(A) polymerase